MFDTRGTSIMCRQRMVERITRFSSRWFTSAAQSLKRSASQEKLASLLKRQHQVIIAAIKAGRIEELIRHSLKQQARKEAKESQSTKGVASPQTEQSVNTVDRINVPARQHAIPSS